MNLTSKQIEDFKKKSADIKDCIEQVSLAEKIVEAGDKRLALEIYKKSEGLAETFNDFRYLADSIVENLKDKMWSRKIYNQIVENANCFDHFKELADSIFVYLGDKKQAEKLYKYAEKAANKPREWRDLAESIKNNLNEEKRSQTLYQKGLYVIKDLNKNIFGFRREGFGQVVYVSPGEPDHFAISQIVDYAYTDTTVDDDGEEVQDWTEYDPSSIETIIAGNLEDE